MRQKLKIKSEKTQGEGQEKAEKLFLIRVKIFSALALCAFFLFSSSRVSLRK